MTKAAAIKNLKAIPAKNHFHFSLILSGPKTKTMAVYNFISYGKIDWAGIGVAANLIVLRFRSSPSSSGSPSHKASRWGP